MNLKISVRINFNYFKTDKNSLMIENILVLYGNNLNRQNRNIVLILVQVPMIGIYIVIVYCLKIRYYLQNQIFGERIHDISNLNEPFILTEVELAIQKLANGKSCSLDGIPSEFYKNSLNIIAPYLALSKQVNFLILGFKYNKPYT